LKQEIANNHHAGKKLNSLPKIAAFYQEVNNAVNKTWQEEGGNSII